MNEDELRDLIDLNDSIDASNTKDTANSLFNKFKFPKLGVKTKVFLFIVLFIFVVGYYLKDSEFVLSYLAKKYSKNLIKVELVEKVDSKVKIVIDGNETLIEATDEDLKGTNGRKVIVYKSNSGDLESSSLNDLLAAFENNELVCSINGKFIIFSYSNSDPNIEGSSIINSDKSSCRYMKLEDSYLIEVYNPSYSKYDNQLLYFNLKGETNIGPSKGFEYFIEMNREATQVLVPVDSSIETICENIMKALDTSYVGEDKVKSLKDSIKGSIDFRLFD